MLVGNTAPELDERVRSQIVAGAKRGFLSIKLWRLKVPKGGRARGSKTLCGNWNSCIQSSFRRSIHQALPTGRWKSSFMTNLLNKKHELQVSTRPIKQPQSVSESQRTGSISEPTKKDKHLGWTKTEQIFTGVMEIKCYLLGHRPKGERRTLQCISATVNHAAGRFRSIAGHLEWMHHPDQGQAALRSSETCCEE